MPDSTPSPARQEWGRLGGQTAAANSTPEERSERARAAVNARWAKAGARRQAADTARGISLARYYAVADAQGVTDPAEREQIARAAAHAHMSRIRAARLTRLRKARQAAEAAAQDEEAAGCARTSRRCSTG